MQKIQYPSNWAATQAALNAMTDKRIIMLESGAQSLLEVRTVTATDPASLNIYVVSRMGTTESGGVYPVTSGMSQTSLEDAYNQAKAAESIA